MIVFDTACTRGRANLIDLLPRQADLVQEAMEGLVRTPKTLPCKFFYDDLGTHLFEAIAELPEYYLTRVELAIMRDAADEMAECVGPHATIVEFGSGAGCKLNALLDALVRPHGCVLIDISRAALSASVPLIEGRYHGMEVLAVYADYTRPLRLPQLATRGSRLVAYFPGSTIGNFNHVEAVEFLSRVAALVGAGGGLLIGIDRKKDAEIIEAAYNDSIGVTSAFNKNVLRRLNQYGANFDIARFRHHAPYLQRLDVSKCA